MPATLNHAKKLSMLAAPNGVVHDTSMAPEGTVYLWFAGQQGTKRYVFIPGTEMRRPQRTYAARSSRNAVQLAVACCCHGGIFCREVSGTKYPGYKQKQYMKPGGQPYSKMGAEEYADFLKAAWQHFMSDTGFRRRSHQAWLVHDRDTAHTSKRVQSLVDHLGLQTVLTPPRSPDLQPLDYGVFGNCKRQLAKQSLQQEKWPSTAVEFKNIVQDAPFRKAIEQFYTRLKACIAAGGQHFESRLSAMQKTLVQEAHVAQ